MKLIVFGASGKVGRLVVEEALRRNYRVTAFVHNKELPPAEGLTSTTGDVYDRASVEAALDGQDAIICALSSWGRSRKNVLSTAMQMIIPAAEAAGIERLVSLTGWAAGPGTRETFATKVGRALINGFAPKVLRDGEDHIAILTNSSLTWTVIRSSVMTNGHSEAYELDRKSGSLTISRHAVAKAMVDLAETHEWPKTAPFIRPR